MKLSNTVARHRHRRTIRWELCSGRDTAFGEAPLMGAKQEHRRLIEDRKRQSLGPVQPQVNVKTWLRRQ